MQLTVPLSKKGGPLFRQVYVGLREAILSGAVSGCEKLPSTRDLAEHLGISRTVALLAYDQLLAEGFAVGRAGSGTYVSKSVGTRRPVGSEKSVSVRLSRFGASAAAAWSRMNFPVQTVRALPYDFPYGRSDLGMFPFEMWRRIMLRCARSARVRELDYGSAHGNEILREAICNHLRRSRAVISDSSQVIVVNGSQQALDLIARVLLGLGEPVAIEDPSYQGTTEILRAAGARLLRVGVDREGIDPAKIPEKARVIFVTPSHQYPTGSVLSPARRMALLERARAAGALIIEDDYDSEFRHGGPPLAAMQGLVADAPVVYLGTFSKTMFPALRLAFIVVPAALAGAFAQMQAQGAARGRVAEQLALAEFLRSGLFARHVRRMRRLYRQRRDALSEALQRHACAGAVIHGGTAGMHLALRFHDSAWDDLALSRRAAQDGIVALALSAHGTGEVEGWNGFLLGYAQVPAENMDGLARRLGALLAQSGAAGQAKRTQ